MAQCEHEDLSSGPQYPPMGGLDTYLWLMAITPVPQRQT